MAAAAVVSRSTGLMDLGAQLTELLASPQDDRELDQAKAALTTLLPAILEEAAVDLKVRQPRHAAFWDTLAHFAASAEDTACNRDLIRRCLVAIGLTVSSDDARDRVQEVFEAEGRESIFLDEGTA